ncbi:MAG: DNA repair protein RecO [Angelakisella sp.]
MQTATDALVLRERKLDEQDRLLTLLSAEQGIITAYAKGAGRMKGSMAGATELLCYSHFVLFQNRDRCFADRAEANTLFFGIRGNLEKLTLATYFAQLCCELIPENEPAAEELRLMLNTLYYLEQGNLALTAQGDPGAAAADADRVYAGSHRLPGMRRAARGRGGAV